MANDEKPFNIDGDDRERFWQTAREQLARLKADPVAWQDYLDELADLDALAGDGLEGEEPYYTADEVRQILANAEGDVACGAR